MSAIAKGIASGSTEDRRHAGRVALGLMLPGVVVMLSGHWALMLYAVLGSFTGMYGRTDTPEERLHHQFHGAAMIITGVCLGTVLATWAPAAPVVVLGITLFATMSSLVTDRLRLVPAGPFFGIFAIGASATMAPADAQWWFAVLTCTATAGYCVVLGQVAIAAKAPSDSQTSDAPASVDVGARLRTGLNVGVRRTVIESARQFRALTGAGSPGPRYTRLRNAAERRWDLPAGSAVQAGRYALATGIAGALGLLIGVDHANWAMAAAAVPLAVVAVGQPLDLRAVVDRGVHRLVGTLAGLIVTAAILLPMPGQAIIAAVVIVLLFPTELFMSRHHGLALGFFTPLIMLMTELVVPTEPLEMLTARGLDTVIGVCAAFFAAAVVRGSWGLPRARRPEEV